MAISGLAVGLLLLGAIPIILAGDTIAGAFAVLGIVVGVWLVLIIVDFVLATSPRKLHVARELPVRIRLGEHATSRVLLTNLAGRGMQLHVRDCWEPSAGAATTRAKLRIPAGERRGFTLQLTPWRRGDRRSERLAARSWGPMRLAARQVALEEPGIVRVLPAFASRKHLPSRVMRLRELDGQTTLQVRGAGTEFDSLRDYVRGDDVRSIDWRATARKRDLVVRTWRPERDRQVIIVIDTGRSAAARVADETRLDTAIEAALLCAALASRAGDRVSMVAYDQRVRARVRGSGEATLLASIVDAMADVEPELLHTNWLAVPGLVREFTNQRSLVVVLTTADSTGSARDLLEMLPQLTNRHLVVVASIEDPQLREVGSTLDAAEPVYRAAAAQRALTEAEQTRRAIQRVGADQLTATPYGLPPRLADHYLALKKAGRL